MAAEDYVEAYKGLLLYGVSEASDRALIRSIVEKIEIFPERQDDGRIVKSIQLKVPFDISEEQRKKLNENGWDYEDHVETVVLLSRVK